MKKVILILVLILFLVACTPKEPRSPTELANPASVHCVEQGGTLEIRTDPGGNQEGWCVFFDQGIECEEWEFYRGECP
ncbi:MAG: DUF333 domain-containing protein [Nanoarchaeota archaeon]|nr:DUF333 domain-containing protein [Nanoarchaeota archaeon]